MTRRAPGAALAAVLLLAAGCSGDAAAPVTSALQPTVPTSVAVAASGPATGTEPPPTSAVAVTSVPVPVSSTSSAPVAASTTTPEEWCGVASDLNGLTTAFRTIDASDTAAVELSLIAILERLDTIAALAPPHLVADVAVSAEAFEFLDAALADVGYDVGDADLADLDARADEIAAANDRIRDYNRSECGFDAGLTGDTAP